MQPVFTGFTYDSPFVSYDLISIKKDLGTIPEWKRTTVMANFTALFQAYGHCFPFFYDHITNTVHFRMPFSLQGLISFIKQNIGIVEMRGCNAHHFSTHSTSLEVVDQLVVEFLLYSIPAIERIALEDLHHFRLLIRELAFKKLSTSFNQEVAIGFSNASGPDFEITFSANDTSPDYVQSITGQFASLSIDPFEETLFGKEGVPSFELFFETYSLAQLIQAPLNSISYINKRLALNNIIGFDLTERALKEEKPATDVAWAFIQDATRIKPMAVRKVTPTFVKEVKNLFQPSEADELLINWMKQALLSDQELAVSLVRYSESKAVLKSFNKAVCTNTTKDKVPYYFLYRGTFASDDTELLDEDLLALSLLPQNTNIACFKNALDVALSRLSDFEKISAILEKAVSEDSTLWTKAGALKQHHFTTKGCCHLLNACAPHFDKESLLFWLGALLDRLRNEKKTAAASLKKEVVIESVKILDESSIFAHKEINKLFSKQELAKCYASFLNGILKRALRFFDPELEAIAFGYYVQFFPKLELKSEKEIAATNHAIKILCKNRGVELFFEMLSALASSVLTEEGHSDLAKRPLDVLLWCINEEVKQKRAKHVKPADLKRWKERFFEIACSIMHTLLDAPPAKNEKANGSSLTIVAQLLGGILRGNPQRNLVMPIFEKMVFSPLSTCSTEVYKENIRNARVLYNTFIEKQLLLNAYPHARFKTIFLTHNTVWFNNTLSSQERLALFNEVLDFQITAKLPEALHITCDIMKNSTRLLFGADDDELRVSTFKKVIEAVFTMPEAKVEVPTNNFYSMVLQLSNGKNILPINTEQREVPLIAALIDCMMDNGVQYLVHDNKDIAEKGYPLVKMVIEKLINLRINNNERIIDLIFYLWAKADCHKIIHSEVRHVELLRLNITEHMLQKVLAHKSWQTYAENYFNLLTCKPVNAEVHDAGRSELFLYFIKALLNSNDKKIFQMGTNLLNKGMNAGLYKQYKGSMEKDGLMDLLMRKL